MNAVSRDYGIILVVESWLNEAIYDPELFGFRYIIHMRDRGQLGTGKSSCCNALTAI